MQKESIGCAPGQAKTNTATRVQVALALVLGVAAAICLSSPAWAADNQAQALYKRDRAACLSGESRQERSACLQEAGAALQAARMGRLTVADADQRRANTLARCDAQPAEDRHDCIRRMQGEGSVSGTAADGGIYREMTTRTVTPASSPR